MSHCCLWGILVLGATAARDYPLPPCGFEPALVEDSKYFNARKGLRLESTCRVLVPQLISTQNFRRDIIPQCDRASSLASFDSKIFCHDTRKPPSNFALTHAL